MANNLFSKTNVTEYAESMPYRELRIQRGISVPKAEAEGRLPTLEEATSSLDKEWAKGRGFEPEKYRYESGIGYPITKEGLRAFNLFWFENMLLSHRSADDPPATRFITGWVARAESSSHYPVGDEEGTMLITHGLALFDQDKKMEVVKWYFDVHSHPGHSFRANILDLEISMRRSKRSFIVSESGILDYGGDVNITLDDLANLGVTLDDEDKALLGQNVHMANSIGKYAQQIVNLAGGNYNELNLFEGEDVELISNYLGIPFRLYKWDSNEIADVLAYMNGNKSALAGFNREALEDKFLATKSD